MKYKETLGDGTKPNLSPLNTNYPEFGYNVDSKDYGRGNLPHEVKVFFNDSYWDGMLSGMCEVNGNKFWFTFAEELELEIDEDENVLTKEKWYRRFWILKMTKSFYKKQVHLHTGWHLFGKKHDAFNRHRKFSKENKHIKDECDKEVMELEVVGWFEW